MYKIIGLILTLTTATAFANGSLQDADFATLSQITGAGGTSAQLLNATRIYDTVNAQQLSVTLGQIIYQSGSAPFTGNESFGGFAHTNPIANASTTGTTVNKLAKLSGAPSTALIAATTDTSGVVGVVVSGAGTAGNAQIAVAGIASCVFDGATTAGDYVQISSTTAGDCHDAGSSYPASGQVLGRVLSTNGAGGTFGMTIDSPDIVATSSGGTVTSVSIVTANGLAGTVATATTTPAITLSTTITGVLKGNGTAISAAVAGTDYEAPFTWVQEVPSGTVNNSNVTFTLAHTPKSNGSVLVYLDGLVLNQGVDYTLSSATITMTVAPNFNQKIYASYAF